jgi:hypothetical protein
MARLNGIDYTEESRAPIHQQLLQARALEQDSEANARHATEALQNVAAQVQRLRELHRANLARRRREEEE